MAIQMTKQIVDPSSLINCQKLINIAVSELEILNGSVNKLDTSIPSCMDSIRSARNKLNTTYNNLINLIYLLGNEANNYSESEFYLFNGKSISDIFASGNLAEMNEVLTYLDEVRNKSKDEYNELVKEYENGNLSIDGDLLKCINFQSDSDDDEYNTTYKEFASFLEIEQDDYDKNYSLDKFIISGTSGDAVGITKENGKFILKKQKILRNGKVIWVRTGDTVPDSVYESAKEYFEQRENLEQILKLGNEKLGPLYEKLQNKLDESNNYDELYRQGSYAVKLAPFAQAFKTDEYKNCSISDKDISDFKDDSNIKRNPSLSRGNAKKWENVIYLLNNSDFEGQKKLLYIYNTMGEDGLLNYVDAMDDSIERQKGINDAINVLKEVSNSENFGDYAWDTLVVAANGVSDGVGSYLEGIGNTLGGADGKVSALEYKRSYLLQQLSGMASNNMSEIESEYKNGSINEEQYNTLVKLAGISDVRKGVYKHTYNISNSFGNMVIPIGVNVLTGSGIGTALTSVSMFGNDLESNLQNGVVGAEAYVSAFGTAAMNLLASKTGMGINPLGNGTISSGILTNAKIYGGEILERNLFNLASGAYKDITYDVFHKDLPWVKSSKPDYLYNSVKSMTSNFVSDSIDTLASSFLMQGTKLALQKGSEFVGSKYSSYINKKTGSDIKIDKPELTYTYNGILRDLKDSYNSGEISYGEYIKYKDAMTLNYTYNMGDIMFNSSKNAVNTNKEALEVYEKSGFKGFFDFLAKNTTKIETDLYNVRNAVKSKPDNVVELDNNSYVVDNSKPNRLQRLEGPLSEENLAVYEADSDLRMQLKSKADELTRRAVKGLTLYKNTLLYNESEFDFGPIIKRAEESINRGDFREIYTACNAALNSRLSNGLTIYDYAKRMGMNAIPLAIQTQNKSMRNSAFFRQYKFYGIRQDVLSYSRITSDVDNVVERYFPHLSEVKKVALLRNAKGMCTYASVAGSIMAAFKKLPYGDIIYEGVFGYPLETKLKDGSVILNESPLLLDLYCFANKNNSTIFSDDNVEIGKYYFCRNAGRDNAVISHFLNQYFPGISVTETISIPKYFEPSEIADLFLKHDYSILGLAPYEDNNIAENIFSRINFYNAAGFKKHTLRSTGHSAIISGFDYDNMELNLSSWGQHIYVKVDEIVKNFRLKKSNPTGQMRIIGLDFDFGPVIKNGVGYFIEHLMNSGNFNTSVLRNLDYSAIQQATSCGLKLGELIQRYVIARAKNHTLTTHDTLDLPLPILTSDIYPGKGFISYINELCPDKPTPSYNPGYELYEKKIILNPIYRPKLISNPSSKSSRLSGLFKNGYKVFRNGINYHVAREIVLNAQNFIDHGNFNPILKFPKSLLDSKLDNGMTVYEYAVSKGMKEIPEAINIMKREGIIRPFYSEYKYFGVRQDILESSDLTDDLSSIIDGYFPGLNDDDKVSLLKRAEGMCTYASIVQGLMQKYKSMPNGELLYELTFGYPMEIVEDGKKVLNEKPIMLDLFCFTNEKNRIFDENNEIYTFFSDDKSDTSIVNSFLSKHGASVQMDETFYSIDALNSAFIYNDVAVLNVYDNTKNRGLIDRNLHRAIYYRMNGSKDVILRNGGHSSNIVGIDLENGRVYVSSWGTEGYVKLSELNAANLNNDENGELFVSTVNFRLTGDVQKKISDYVINGIKNNDLDKIDGQLVIDSKYAPLIAKTLIDSAKAGTLDPDILKKIPQSLLLQKVDGISLIQSLLENSHGNRSLFIDAMKDKLSASTLADINSYVYGGFGLEDASNNPLAAYIYAKNGNFDFIKSASRDVLDSKVSIGGKFQSMIEHFTSFAKKLTTLSTVPKDVRRKIFNRTLTFEEYIKYGLDGVIPISRINLVERPVVEKFGVEKAKTLDWALLNKCTDDGISIRDILMNMDSSTEDIITKLYELVKDRISPSFYTPKMKEIYSDRLFSDDDILNSQYGVSHLMHRFNDGELSLNDIVENWDLFKDKDLGYCLARNKSGMSDSSLKKFMIEYGEIVEIINRNLIIVDMSKFVKNVVTLSKEARKDCIKQLSDRILSDIMSNLKPGDYNALSNDECKEIFKYSSMEDCLRLYGNNSNNQMAYVIQELKTLPQDYIFTTSIPFLALLNDKVSSFVATCGLKNIGDFDNEYGHFFTKNDCEILRLMSGVISGYDLLDIKANTDGNDSRAYTKDEFYEALREMIMYVPYNMDPTDYIHKISTYRGITGEFRKRNADLFISDEAPEELQDLFYSRSITPEMIREHSEYIKYLDGKDPRVWLKNGSIRILSSKSSGFNLATGAMVEVSFNAGIDKRFYSFVRSKTDSIGLINFIKDYSDLVELVSYNGNLYLDFSNCDSIDDIKKIIGDKFKERLEKGDCIYPKYIPQEVKNMYPSFFLSDEAPEELQNLFYSQSITPEIIREHPEYIEYLDGKDPKLWLKDNKDLYSVISKKTDFRGLINFIEDYGDLVELVFHHMNYDVHDFNMEEIKKIIGYEFKRGLVLRNFNYPKHIPQEVKSMYPSLFLSDEAPEELKNLLYNSGIDERALSNPLYKKYLLEIDPELLHECIPVRDENGRTVNFIRLIDQTFGDNIIEVLLSYGKYIDISYGYGFNKHVLDNFHYRPGISREDFLDELDSCISSLIIDGTIMYDEDIPESIKKRNPTLFLDESVSQEIKDKFYNRKFTIKDFEENPDLLDLFGDTNIAYGLPERYFKIVAHLFNDCENQKQANFYRLRVLKPLLRVTDDELNSILYNKISEMEDNVDFDMIDIYAEALCRFALSNSSEITRFKKELATRVINASDPLESLKRIEDIFIRNYLPTVGKVWTCFEMLYPNFQGLYFNNSKVSPILSGLSNNGRKLAIFSDLIKSSFGSNNRSIKSYLKIIEDGSILYNKVINGQRHYELFTEEEKKLLTKFSKCLVTLHDNTMKGKKESFVSTGDVVSDIKVLSSLISHDGRNDYNIADRIVNMFCGFAGIHTLKQAKEYIDLKVSTADKRNRDAAKSDMELEVGDFVKGIGNITYLRSILQNGSNAKEYLGASAESDATPLDTDLSTVLESTGTIRDKILGLAANSCGPIYFVLKNDGRFIITRSGKETLDVKKDMTKLEAFYTGIMGSDHYGIRTGFASSEINYITMGLYDPRVGVDIALNGFYIPVVDFDGNVVFTPEDYDELRNKMQGLSYYGENNYRLSDNLITVDTEKIASRIDDSSKEVERKREKIYEIIRRSVDKLGLKVRNTIGEDLEEGTIELIDTGSTGRGTNKPGDGDFDFMMKLDRNIMLDPSKLQELKDTIAKDLGKTNGSGEVIGTGDFRFKNVQLDDETAVDIDITFVVKTDRVSYSTDMALQDRLKTIKKTAPEQYKYVISNILLAKQVLKQANVYKPYRSDSLQGGLGGVGIENWILQNGGSFIDAARSFVEAADGKTFEEFKRCYQIWDFGENHYSARNSDSSTDEDKYPHDNFVTCNMSYEGYQKMLQALKEYLKTIED